MNLDLVDTGLLEENKGSEPRGHPRAPAHSTPASSRCRQLWRPQPAWAQLPSASSVPAQRTSSSRMGPEPGPKGQRPGALSARPQPRRRHTTRALRMFQWSSHTVPHTPWCRTSTRPSQRLRPPARRRPGAAGTRQQVRGTQRQLPPGCLSGCPFSFAIDKVTLE